MTWIGILGVSTLLGATACRFSLGRPPGGDNFLPDWIHNNIGRPWMVVNPWRFLHEVVVSDYEQETVITWSDRLPGGYPWSSRYPLRMTMKSSPRCSRRIRVGTPDAVVQGCDMLVRSRIRV